jgi:hypothetical protein
MKELWSDCAQRGAFSNFVSTSKREAFLSGVDTSAAQDLSKVTWFSKQWRLDAGKDSDFLTLTTWDEAVVASNHGECVRKELRRA